MKRKLVLILSLLLFLLGSNTYAQLSGVYAIPDSFATIEKAIDSLNQVGVGSGGVTFNVAAGHTETFTKISAGLITATGTSANPIVFQKSGGGANPLITAALSGISFLRDGIIIIAGGDYITFDGIDIQENSGNTNKQNQMEWGFSLVKASKVAPFNGCRFVTIKNCNITLNKADSLSTGIYANNHTADTTGGTFTLTDTLDAMRWCKFYNNTISNVFYGFRFNGSNNALYYDLYNEIGVDGGNSITNYGGGTGQSAGIYVDYQGNFKVANNTVNGGGLSQTGLIYGIRTGSAINVNVDIYNNTVTVIQNSSTGFYGISNSTGGSGTTNTVNIYNNTIQNCYHAYSTGNDERLLYNLASCYNLNIYGNIIKGNTKSAGTGTLHCIYLSPTAATTNAYIYNNQIDSNFSGGLIHGIYLDLGINNYIYQNTIRNLSSTASGTDSSSYVAGITVASGPINTYIYNNFISDLKAPSSPSRNAVRGINITSTTASSNIGLYYNTIYLNASSSSAKFGTSGIYHTYSSTATSAALDMRNNIVVNNSTPNGIGRTSAFRRSASTNLNNYSTVSNNNSFYSGVGAGRLIYYDGTNEDLTIPAFKSRVIPRETASFTENVPFINSTTAPYNLHVNTAISTQTESGGQRITSPISVTNDFDNQLRWGESGYGGAGTNPDVGADEFEGIPADFTPPSILYTQLGHTLSTSNRNLNGVAITDGSGINTTSGTAPRIYFKKYSHANTYVDNTSSTDGWKYVESSTGSSPFDFTINYSLLFGGTGVQAGDTIQYFVVAQDNASPANVGINSGTFAAAPSSVNLTSAAFPLSGTINQYRIQYLINGTVTVGTGGNFPSLTGPKGLFVSIKENFVSGNVIAKVITNTTETGDNTLDQWAELVEANYSLTIQPDTSIVRILSGSYLGGLVRLNGVDGVNIDGRFNGTGNYLTFENTNAAANSTTFQLLSIGTGQGCTDITIRNCNIKAGTNTLSNIFGIFIGSSAGSITTGNAGGVDYDNISILENNISKCRVGIFARGTSSDQMLNFVVSRNIIGSNTASDYVTEYGMYLGYADAPQIVGNEVFNMIYEVSKWGIYFVANVSNAVVSKNKIHSFDQTSTGGFNSVGIYFTTGTGCADNQIDNNMVYDLRTYGSTSMYLVGIRIAGGANYKVYYNTVSLTGAFGNASAGVVSSCLYVSTASTNMNVRDNIFSNTRTGNNPKNYTVHSLNTTTFSQLDYNDYWSTGSVFGFFGADVADFAGWKTTIGKDANSTNVAVNFVSSTDVHVSGASIGDPYLIGTTIPGITTDIDGDSRNGTYPYKGADESTAFTIYSLNLTALIEGFYTPSVETMIPDTVTVELRNTSSPWGLVDKAKTVLSASGAGTLSYLFAQNAANYFIVVKHRNSIETWSKIGQSFSGAALSYDFTTDATKAYGDNMKLKGTKWCIYSGDVIRDEFIDGSDVSECYNASALGVSGYVVTDLTGDDFVDGSDVTIAYNNSNLGVGAAYPSKKVISTGNVNKVDQLDK